MSDDYDRLFHPHKPVNPVDDATTTVDRDAIVNATASPEPRHPDPVSSPSGGQQASWDPTRHAQTAPQSPPPPMPPPPASAPLWPHGQPPAASPPLAPPVDWPVTPAAQPRHADGADPYLHASSESVPANSAGTWPPPTAFPAGPQGQMPGNSRTIDSLSNVSARGGAQVPPRRGWRHWLYTCIRINLGPSPDEIYEYELHDRIRRNTRDAYQIGVFGLKGGAGKTTVTVALGSTMAKIRGDRVLAIDADPDGGNLADRAHRQSAATVRDLLARDDITRYNEIRGFTSMNASNLEVLASPDYSSAQREFSDEDWLDTTSVVSRFYNLVIADNGSGLFQAAARGVLASVSGLVLVASASIDGARQAAVTMDWLRHNGYEELLGRACLVINHVASNKPQVDVDDLAQQFQRHLPAGRVIVLPWDKHVASGGAIHLDRLSRTFQRRIAELAAALSDDFGCSEVSTPR